ncbi:MAG: hypothetical protein KDA72_22850, partial [Planctomycetales bacterium]|nr:hypothetical protein [Planctomycetales bacterium]
RLRARPSPAIITPHPAEAARLLETEAASIQSDRLASAQALARRFNCLALLKGCGSLIAIPDGRWWINGSGHPGMATAGMGDVAQRTDRRTVWSGRAASLFGSGFVVDRLDAWAGFDF